MAIPCRHAIAVLPSRSMKNRLQIPLRPSCQGQQIPQLSWLASPSLMTVASLIIFAMLLLVAPYDALVSLYLSSSSLLNYHQGIQPKRLIRIDLNKLLTELLTNQNTYLSVTAQLIGMPRHSSGKTEFGNRVPYSTELSI